MARTKRKLKSKPATPRRGVLSINTWPRRIDRFSDKQFFAWVQDATQLTREEALLNPRLARERILAAIKRERLVARKKRTPL